MHEAILCVDEEAQHYRAVAEPRQYRLEADRRFARRQNQPVGASGIREYERDRIVGLAFRLEPVGR